MSTIPEPKNERSARPASDPDSRSQSERLSEAGLGSQPEPEDEPTLQDWVEAEHSRPDLPDETADGLDDMDEEVRHQAEDLPLDTPGRL